MITQQARQLSGKNHHLSKWRVLSLYRMMTDQRRDLTGEGLGSALLDKDLTEDYFRELLLTYRLLFGQDMKSHKLFSKKVSKIKDKWKREPDIDPLLQILCGSSCDETIAKSTYDGIEAPGVQAYYTPRNFQFFAKKLLVIRSYVKEQHPHDWKTLWHDHRNKSNWSQFWVSISYMLF
jgi:hypothetical protein